MLSITVTANFIIFKHKNNIFQRNSYHKKGDTSYLTILSSYLSVSLIFNHDLDPVRRTSWLTTSYRDADARRQEDIQIWFTRILGNN